MRPTLFSKTRLLAIGLAGLLGASLSAPALAGAVYTYVGPNFTAISGTGGPTTSDRLTGFVEFAIAPSANESGKSDIIAFSLSDGVRTLSSADGDTLGNNCPGLRPFFTFDASLTVVSWCFELWPEGETDNADSMITRNFEFVVDASRVDAGNTSLAIAQTPGQWTAAQQSVPEPATLPLVALTLGCLGWALRRRVG